MGKRLQANTCRSTPAKERSAIFQAAAAFAETAIGIFAWAQDEPWPQCEYVDTFSAERAGYSREDFMRGTSCFFAIDPLNTAFIHEAHNRALAEDPSHFQAQLANVAGETYWLECSVQRLSPASDGRLRFALIAQNIHEHKHVEDERSLLAAAIEQQPAGVLIICQNHDHPLWPRIIYTNAGFSAITGYTKEEIASGTYPRLLDESSDADQIRNFAQRVFVGQNVSFELVLVRKDKTRFWARVQVHALESPDDYGVVIINDITENRSQRERLSILSEAAENASEYITVTALTDVTEHTQGVQRIIYANRSFCESVGISQEEIIGKRYDEFFSSSNDPKLLKANADNVDSGKENFREIIIRRKDGSEYWMEYAAKPFRSTEGDSFRVTLGRDITLRRRAHNQVSLFLSAFDRSYNRIVLYEADQHDDPVIAYENEAALKSDSHRLLEIWHGTTKRDRDARRMLLAGQELTNVYTIKDEDGIERIVEFSAQGVPNGERLDAVLTVERVLAETESARNYHSRMLQMARLLPAITDAATSAERLAILRKFLRDAFKAKLKVVGPSKASKVRVDAAERCATFVLDATRYDVSWPQPLEESALTAMRFCIEVVAQQK
ncbi:MAG: PAS domain-containing protein [Vulcanimicrobiaceae bacterium]